MSSAVRIKICAITAGIKKYKPIIKKKNKKHDETVLLENDKLNTIEVLICKSLINSYISHDEFVSINNVLKRILWNERRNINFYVIYYTKTMETYCASCNKNTENENC